MTRSRPSSSGLFLWWPAPDAEVRWTVSREPYFFDRWEGEGYYDWTDYDINDDGFGPTGGKSLRYDHNKRRGRAIITLPADISGRLKYLYIIEISIAT